MCKKVYEVLELTDKRGLDLTFDFVLYFLFPVFQLFP